MKTIALCFNTPGMNQAAWRAKDYGKKYPGAGWMRHLSDCAMDGETVVYWVKQGGIKSKDVFIVQEENNPYGFLLQEMGANKSVLTCLESPIFASSFYDNAPSIIPAWNHSLLFGGDAEPLHFPSFDLEDLRSPIPWSERKHLCMVSANKHYTGLPRHLNESSSFQWAMKSQLHDYRYAAIKHFFLYKSDDCHLYGRGWGGEIQECADKLDTVRSYKYALCFENGSYPGYITEKIIDYFVAGVVPVYMGAPDIERFVPKELFIDARQFGSFSEMEHFLRDIDHVQPKSIKLAQEWLHDGDGRKYSNVAFAKKIVNMCDQ